MAGFTGTDAGAGSSAPSRATRENDNKNNVFMGWVNKQESYICQEV